MEAHQCQAALQRALAGDARALEELLDSFRRCVKCVVDQSLRRHHLPQAENHELIERALRDARSEFAGFRGSTIGEFVAWLRGSVARSVSQSPEVNRGQYPEPPPSMDECAERATRIIAAFALLPLDCQLVLLGRHVDDLPPAALAERFGCDEAAIDALYLSALCQLRDSYLGLPPPAAESGQPSSALDDSPTAPSPLGLTSGLAELLEQALSDLRFGRTLDVAALQQRYRAFDGKLVALLDTLSDLDAVLQDWRTDGALSRPAAATRVDDTPPSGGVPMPEQLGRYRIHAEVGGGGMGIVYKAHDPILNRIVAVKVPRPETILKERSQWVRRFLREAQSAAKVRHPHVCPIFDMGENGTTPYVVMAFIDGPSLADYLRAGHQCDDPVAAVRLARQVAEGLEAIHTQGLIHRDLKPGNILIDHDGLPILTDFGLVLPEQDSEHLTTTGAVAGTPAFMAPEQAAGEIHRVGPRTDIYSLGVVLYRILSGRLPFTGPPTTVLWKIVHEKPPPLLELRPNLDPALAAIVQKAMAACPDDRYASTRDLIEALDGWLSRPGDLQPQTAVPMPAAEADAAPPRFPETMTADFHPPPGTTLKADPQAPAEAEASRSNGVVESAAPLAGSRRWGSLVAAALVLLLGAILSLTLFPPRRDNDGPPSSTPPGAIDPEGDLAIIKPQPPELPAGAPLSQKALVTHPPVLEGIRSWTVETRWPRGPVFAIAYRPDGKQLAVAGDDGMIRLWATETRRLLRLLVRHARPVRSVAWSPRGRYLASVGDDGAVCLWDAASGQLLQTWEGHPEGINAVAWSPGGESLATGGADGQVRLWRTLDGAALSPAMMHDGAVLAIAWSPDGKLLACAGRELAVRLWEVPSVRSLWALHKHEVPLVPAVAWSADGTTLASAGADGKVWLWDVASGKPSGTIEPRVPVTALAWSARRRTLCTGSVAGVQTWDSTGRLLQLLGNHQAVIRAVAWSPDGAWVASADEDGVVQFWDNDRPASATIPSHPAGRAAVAWSPDGAILAIAGFSDRALRLWDPATRQFRTLPKGDGPIEPVVAWSPDGKVLATAVDGGKVQLWRLADAHWSPLQGHTSEVLGLAWSPNGKALASASADGSVWVWAPDTAKGRAIFQGHLGGVYAVVWGHDGETLACGAHQKAEIWRRDGNKPLQTFEDFAGPVYAVASSPDGRMLALADGMGDGAVRCWKAAHWEFDRTLGKHAPGVFAIAWASEGDRLASGGADAGVRLWHARTGHLLGELQWHTAAVRSLSWRGATDTLTTSSEDGTMRIGTTKQRQPETVLVPLRGGGGFTLDPMGQGTYPPGSEEDFIIVVQTAQGQETLPFAEFSQKFQGKDGLPRLRLEGK
jgi:WD40 repeat protein/serine/threonine protein kinase